MINRVKCLLTIVFIMAFMLMIGYPVAASEQADSQKSLADPMPINPGEKNDATGKGGNENNETPGEWYKGETPKNLDVDAPILLFVPGLNNTAQIFWEDNDMYQTAHDAGYQTAFVQLYDAGGESADMWDNGELLAEKISEISDYFNGKPITLVAYSKGGVDSQTATTYYGAWKNVENVITLSSPHHGSQLADLAYSFWAGWLADLIGMQGEGTYALETGYMENFRSEMDSEPLAYQNDYFTLGGEDWGSMFSSTWFGGNYLSSYGDNDGVVTTESSNLPGGQELAIGEWDHSTIRTGLTFDVFQSYINNSELVNYRDTTEKSNQAELTTSVGNQWIHGGALAANDVERLSIPVEENVKGLSLDIMTATPVVIKVTDPDGKESNLHVNPSKNVEGLFTGAFSNQIKLDHPNVGEWQVELQSNKESGYLLVADYEANAKIQYYHARGENQNKALTFDLTANAFNVQEDSLRATYHVIESGNMNNVKKWSVKGNENLSQTLTFDKKNKVYNISVDITGITKSGYPFKRTVVDSVYSGK